MSKQEENIKLLDYFFGESEENPINNETQERIKQPDIAHDDGILDFGTANIELLSKFFDDTEITQHLGDDITVGIDIDTKDYISKLKQLKLTKFHDTKHMYLYSFGYYSLDSDCGIAKNGLGLPIALYESPKVAIEKSKNVEYNKGILLRVAVNVCDNIMDNLQLNYTSFNNYNSEVLQDINYAVIRKLIGKTGGQPHMEYTVYDSRAIKYFEVVQP